MLSILVGLTLMALHHPLAAARRGGVQDEVSLLQTSLKTTMQQRVERAVRKLWSGEDLSGHEMQSVDALLQDSKKATRTASVSNATSSRLKHIFLLGPPGTGTNLMVASLNLNWPAETLSACKSNKSCDTQIWKHSVSSADELFHAMNQWTYAEDSSMSKALVLIMVRSPISQLKSWKWNPYSLRRCLGPWRPLGGKFSRCWANTGPAYFEHTDQPLPYNANRSVWFKHGVDVYNKYLQQYNALLQDKRIGKVLLVPYEDLVMKPEVELNRVASAMGWPLPKSGLSFVQAKAKNFGLCKDRKLAIESLLDRTHLDFQAPYVVKSLCRLLDLGAMKGLYEGTHTREPVPYREDCDVAQFAVEPRVVDTLPRVKAGPAWQALMKKDLGNVRALYAQQHEALGLDKGPVFSPLTVLQVDRFLGTRLSNL